MFIWDFVAAKVLGQIVDWFYSQIVGFLGNFFSEMGNMGAELFTMDWVQSIVLFFSYLAWALYGTGLVVACFETGVEYSSGRGNIRETALNAIKGFMAVSLFTIVPVRLYELCVSLQGTFTAALTGYGTSIGDVAGEVMQEFNAVESITDLTAGPLLGFGSITSGIMILFCLILMAYAVVKVFFANLKRGGILLIQIAVGSLYKSMAAMIQNDEEKAWMLPMLEFRNEIAGYGDWQTDRDRRDFRKRDGRLQWHNNRLVHGPYTKETREYFLRRLLEVELLVHEIGPDEIKDVPLITMEELKFIRQLWLDEFHEFDDSLPRIYEEVTGKKYSDGTISKNKYFGATEAELLKEVCAELYPNEQLLAEMQRALLDTEAKAAAISNKRNVILNFEKEIKKAFYKDEADAESIASTRALRISGITDEANPDDLVD